MNRRNFLRLSAATALLPALHAPGQGKSKPNVLFMAIDDLND